MSILTEFYRSKGLKKCSLTRFEEYDFYADKKDFLQQKNILTFTDLNGQLMAMRPDVTLSVIRKGIAGKFYYRESVYRAKNNRFSEIKQEGVEFLGDLEDNDIKNLCSLAIETLRILAGNRNFILDAADASVCKNIKTEELKLMNQKNIEGLKKLKAVEAVGLLNQKTLSEKYEAILNSLDRKNISVDYSAVSNLNYYNGLIIKGYIEGYSGCVLSGGEYGGLLRSMNTELKTGAGFAVYLDRMEDYVND